MRKLDCYAKKLAVNPTEGAANNKAHILYPTGECQLINLTGMLRVTHIKLTMRIIKFENGLIFRTFWSKCSVFRKHILIRRKY